ncbi:MAG: hypothetical protein JNM93_00775 [Bacteriovoracaceae bacterium]|nr:hypothetical protein [Bacteriovoracaceae bacterium]
MLNLACRLIRHLCRYGMGFFCLINSIAYAGPSRAPANFSPDDDIIFVPVEVKEDYIDSLIRMDNGKINPKIIRMKETALQWQIQNEFMQSWKLEDTGFPMPTPEEKKAFVNRQFLRYFTTEAGEPYKASVSNWWDRWNNSQDEVDYASSQQTLNDLGTKNATKKEIAISRRYKFTITPKVYRGLVTTKLVNPYLDLEFNAGINGRTEFNARKTYDTGTTAFISYQLSNRIFIASVDQRLIKNIVARLSTIHDDTLEDPKMRNEQSIQLRYNFSF